MNNNICTLVDSYKVSHYKQYPPDTEQIYSYFESRGGKFPYTVFFGLQYLLKRYLVGDVLTLDKIEKADKKWAAHFGSSNVFNKAGWLRMLEKHGGKLPIRIKAVQEGTIVPVHNVLMTIENTDPEFYWLTNWMETLLSQTWYPTTVATLSRSIKQVILNYLNKTGDPDQIQFKLHDFGFRGVSSSETAAIGGAAHLVNFMGTDTFAGCELLMDYYGAEMPGFSIPAAEHSTITSWGGPDQEIKAFENMLNQYSEGLVAVVSDSYDIFNACTNLWGDKLKDKIVNRNGTLIIRPDSGEPTKIVVDVLNLLGQAFSFTHNNKGYKELPPYLRVIQGDGVSYETIGEILKEMEKYGWSANNVAFGSGGALLQKVDRDTQKFAFKACSGIFGGKQRDIYKSPITDSGKRSKKGRLILKKEKDSFSTVVQTELNKVIDSMHTVFENGVLLKDWTFQEIRMRAKI